MRPLIYLQSSFNRFRSSLWFSLTTYVGMWVDYSKVSKTSSYDLRHAATEAPDWICIYYCETMVPQSEAVRRLIPHIELEIMPKAGHLHNVDQRLSTQGYWNSWQNSNKIRKLTRRLIKIAHLWRIEYSKEGRIFQ